MKNWKDVMKWNDTLCMVSIAIAGMVLGCICGLIAASNKMNEPSAVTPPTVIVKPVIEYRDVIVAREESVEVGEEITPWIVNVTLEELEMMSRVVMSEASIVPYIGKVCVAQVLINRLNDGRWGSTMKEVITYPDAFSMADNGEVTDECRQAVLQALEGGAIFPEDMLYFRDSHYHDFGYDYMSIDNLYFTTEKDYEVLANGICD